jgi:hypothetical protein
MFLGSRQRAVAGSCLKPRDPVRMAWKDCFHADVRVQRHLLLWRLCDVMLSSEYLAGWISLTPCY